MFVGWIKGLRFEFESRVEVKKDEYKMFPRLRVAKIGFALYEDAVIDFYNLGHGRPIQRRRQVLLQQPPCRGGGKLSHSRKNQDTPRCKISGGLFWGKAKNRQNGQTCGTTTSNLLAR